MFMRAAFVHADPKSIIKTNNLMVFFALSGSTGIKAAGRTLMNLTPGVNFTNILHTAFTLVGPKSAKQHCQFDCLFLRIWDL